MRFDARVGKLRRNKACAEDTPSGMEDDRCF